MRALLLSICLCAISMCLFAQCDNFDTYITDSVLCPQSNLWTTWDDNPGGPYDCIVSDAVFLSFPNSIYLNESIRETDIVLDLGQKTSGSWDISLDIFIPEGFNGAYYNVMQDMELFGQINEWGFQVYFNSDGIGYFYDSEYTQTEFFYNRTSWNHTMLRVNLDSSLATFYVNCVELGTWQWDIWGFNKLGALNLYTAADGSDVSTYYIDNVCFNISPEPAADLVVYPKNVLPVTICPGDTIRITSKVMNIGLMDSDQCLLSYFLSEDNILDTSDINLGSTENLAILSGETYDHEIDLEIPGFIQNGAYTLLLLIDSDEDIVEENEENNVSGYPITIEGPYLNVMPPSVELGYEQGEFEFSIQSNVNWEIDEDCIWLICSPRLGQNDDSILVLYDQNNSGITRYCNIKISSEDRCDSVQVIQESDMSIGENYSPDLLLVYPNPASHTLNIRLPESSTAEILQVYDCFGKQIEEHNIQKPLAVFKIDVSNYLNGIYLLIIETESGILFKQKFVIAR